jgi:hypothetical protein
MKLIKKLHPSFFIFLLTGMVSIGLANEEITPLTQAGQRIEDHYAQQLTILREDLKPVVPSESEAKGVKLKQFLASDNLDPKLVNFVILDKATPRALAEFGQQGKNHFSLLERLFNAPKLMRQMLVADGARAKRMGRKGYGPPQYAMSMVIYSKIQDSCKDATTGIFQRLALAISLEHAVPVVQTNPAEDTNAPETVDPVKRYHHYKKAYLDGELDPTFKNLSTWDLRMVVNGDEPDETLAWGREMLRNYRPDHIYNENFGWRYVAIVGSDVKYGSGDVKYDRPELQKVPKHFNEWWSLWSPCIHWPFYSSSFWSAHYCPSKSWACRTGPLDAKRMVRKPRRRVGSWMDQYPV